jgi:hypothetical protein
VEHHRREGFRRDAVRDGRPCFEDDGVVEHLRLEHRLRVVPAVWSADTRSRLHVATVHHVAT